MARQKSLGELEQQVMEFLWEHGPATGEAVRSALKDFCRHLPRFARARIQELTPIHFMLHVLLGFEAPQHRANGRIGQDALLADRGPYGFSSGWTAPP